MMRTDSPSGAGRWLRGLSAAGAFVFLLAGCSQSDTPTADTTDELAASPQLTAAEDDPMSELAAAIDRTSQASTRSFTSTVQVATTQGPAEVQLAGSLDGDTRTLTVTTEAGTIAYTIAAGVATVDRGDGPEPVELAEVPAAPSLEYLSDIGDPEWDGPGIVRGTIDAQFVLGETATGVVQIVIRFEPGGFVQRLELDASDGSISATVDFTDMSA